MTLTRGAGARPGAKSPRRPEEVLHRKFRGSGGEGFDLRHAKLSSHLQRNYLAETMLIATCLCVSYHRSMFLKALQDNCCTSYTHLVSFS